MLLTGKTAIVTGGSRGIGKEIILTFLEQGASIVYNVSRTNSNPEQFDEAAKKYGGKVVFKKSDVAKESEINACIKQIIDESGGLDVIVNNAGITHDNFLYRMSVDEWEEVLKVNLTSVFFICKAVVMHMSKRRAGSIINIASVVGIGGNTGQTNYSASKAGIIGFSKSFAKEVAPRGIRVNVIAPGFIDTEMTAKMGKEMLEQYVSAFIPLKRLGQPRDVANTAAFLASDLSAFITGQVIRVDGGSIL